MNHKKLNFLSDIYFSLILFIGFSYLVFLVFSFLKIFPGFAMQLIFLLDSLKFGHSISGLLFSYPFLLNVAPGLLLSTLFVQLTRSIVILAKNIRQTSRLISSLNIVKPSPAYLKFKSKNASIFTLGFLRPKIFISSAIFQTHTQSEIKSMLQHELNHRNNLHPLKIFISNFIKSATPAIIGKEFLFDSYLTSTEVSSDIFAASQTHTKKPLVSSLLKFQNHSFETLPASISYFNSQSERIKILVGQKKPSQNIPLIYGSLTVILIMISALSIKNTNIFYECQHLVKCVQTLVTPSGPSITTFDH